MTDLEQHALSIKHLVQHRIVELVPGIYALFGPWSNEEGLSLLATGPIDFVARLIPTADALVDEAEAKARHRPVRAQPEIDLDDLFGGTI